MRMIRAFVFPICVLVSVAMAGAAPDPAGLAFFETHVRPTLVQHCYKCHSADAATAGKLKGDLLLDSRQGVARGGKSGPIFTAGKPDESRLIEAVRYGNPDLQMPPKDRLSPEAVTDLEKWIAMGAPDPRQGAVAIKQGIDIEAGKRFWAFQPLHRVDPPADAKVGGAQDWIKTPIDAFVLAAQQRQGLHPNPPASRAKLIRRAYLDLLGIPPTPQEIDAFTADDSPDAYAKLIDRLLQNPAYGERWARHWLDVARFGESDGFEQDYDRPAAYQYRDFVIRALNGDMPFDRFVQWQIAGDELAPDDWQALAATGFLTAGTFPTQITEKEFESTRYNQLDDMISTLGNAMLGLTVGCARCHDHKYDPIPTEDYYRLAATFATAIRSDIDLDLTTPAEKQKLRDDWQEAVKVAEGKLKDYESGPLEKEFQRQIESVKHSPDMLAGEWEVLHLDAKTADGAKYVSQPDGSLLASGKLPDHETLTLTAQTRASKITALRVEALTDKSLPHHGPGAGTNGNFALTEIEIFAAPASGAGEAASARIVSAIATHEQNNTSLSVNSAFDGKSQTGWAIDGGIGKNQAAIFNFEKPLGFAEGTVLTIVMHFDHASVRHLIGRPRLSISDRTEPKDFIGHEGPGAAIAQTFARLAAGDDVSPSERQAARDWIASADADDLKLKAAVQKLKHAGPPQQLTKVQVTSEGLPPVKNNADGRGYPHFYKTVYRLRRGDPNNKVEPATMSFPQVLMRGGKDAAYWQTAPPAETKLSYRRSALARWIVDADNGAGPLLARVIVNRLWQHHFGRGIVATPNDFGVQGDRPTHPELLDWLATDLIEHGWQLKRLHKLMMTSAVYMQNADTSADREKIDPHDVYLWRWQPRRLDAEPIRDSMLSVSGLLDETMFGPGALDQGMRRRSIYFTVKRSGLIPMMMVLDWPEPLNSVGARPTTTVAPQALLFMNSPQARQYAEAFARRVRSQSPETSVDNAYRIAFGRAPERAETESALKFIDKQLAGYREGNLPDATVAALADFCQAMLSANEFVYVD